MISSKITLPITLIIPTFNRPQSLLRTLKSINNLTFLPSELLIIDQSSDNLSFNLITSNLGGLNKDLNVKFLKHNPPSSSVARNIGIDKAKNEILVFSDDDVDYYNEVFKIIFDSYNKNQKLSLIAAYDKDHKFKLSSLLSILAFRKSLFQIFRGHVTKSILGNFPIIRIKAKTNWAMGFFFSIKKSICIQNNIFFDLTFKDYSYAEDLDFTYRYIKALNKNKLEAYFLPNIIVNHLVSKEFRIKDSQFYFIYLYNRYYIIKKNFNSSIIYIINFYISNFFFSIMLFLKNKKTYKNFSLAYKTFKKRIVNL